VENTIVFYVSDHGGIMIRSKRFLYDSGTNVPFIAYFPKKWEHLAPKGYAAGTVSDRLVDFTDIITTLVHLCGAEIPKTYEGKIFAGKSPEEPKEHVYLFSGRFDESPDLSRALTDGRYKYIRNYEPDRRLSQLLSYPLGQSAQLAHFRAYEKGGLTPAQAAIFNYHVAEEFYDTQSDSDEVVNLIGSVDHQDLIMQFRKQLDEELMNTHDLGFIPEPLMAEINATDMTIYDWARGEGNYPLDALIDLANLAAAQDPDNLSVFQKELGNENPVIRYWAALGLRLLGKEAAPAEEDLQKATKDSDFSTRITALMALGNVKGLDAVRDLLLNEADKANGDIDTTWALGGLKYLNYTSLKDHPQYSNPKHFNRGGYSARCLKDLLSGKTYTRLPKANRETLQIK